MITNKDLKLLYELDTDSRQSLPHISKKIHISQQLINYRLKNLQKNGVVSSYFSVIDTTRLGYTTYRVMIQLSKTNDKKFGEIIEFFRKHPNILWLASCGGRFDLIINIMAKNIMHFNRIFNQIRSKFQEQIQNYNVLTIVEVLHFGRSYLINKKRELDQKTLFFGKESRIIDIDYCDKRILYELSENARMSLVDLASKLDLSGNTIANRIKKMKKVGLIQGFRPLIHIEKLGFESYKILIKLQNTTIEKEKKLYGFAQRNPSITFIIKVVGEWDLEFEVEVKSRKDLQGIIIQLRDNFSEAIKEVETIPIYHDYRYNYFPGEIIKGGEVKTKGRNKAGENEKEIV